MVVGFSQRDAGAITKKQPTVVLYTWLLHLCKKSHISNFCGVVKFIIDYKVILRDNRQRVNQFCFKI